MTEKKKKRGKKLRNSTGKRLMCNSTCYSFIDVTMTFRMNNFHFSIEYSQPGFFSKKYWRNTSTQRKKVRKKNKKKKWGKKCIGHLKLRTFWTSLLKRWNKQ